MDAAGFANPDSAHPLRPNSPCGAAWDIEGNSLQQAVVYTPQHSQVTPSYVSAGSHRSLSTL